MTMTRHQLVDAISATGVFPCWRVDDHDGVIDATRALIDAGMNNVELTMTTPDNLRLIERARRELPAGIAVGAGTVLDAETARQAILSGAQYVVAPVMDPAIVAMCHRYDVMVVLGAFTPTEIMAAKTAGADMIKLMPAGAGGPPMLAEMRGPFPGLRVVVTGNVLLGDIAAYMTAGADAVVIGLPHIAPDAFRRRDFAPMRRMAERILAAVRDGRDPERRRRAAEEALTRYVDFERGSTARARAS